jgi:hypothetical protein
MDKKKFILNDCGLDDFFGEWFSLVFGDFFRQPDWHGTSSLSYRMTNYQKGLSW